LSVAQRPKHSADNPSRSFSSAYKKSCALLRFRRLVYSAVDGMEFRVYFNTNSPLLYKIFSSTDKSANTSTLDGSKRKLMVMVNLIIAILG